MQSNRKCGSKRISLTFFPVACKFSFLSYLFSWCKVLDEVNQTSKYLQAAKISLKQGTVKQQALKLLEDHHKQILQKAVNYAT